MAYEANATRPPAGRRVAFGLAAGGKDDPYRLTVVPVVCVEQCRLVDLGDRIGDRFVHTSIHLAFGAQVTRIDMGANLARRPLDAAIEGSRPLGIRDVKICEFDSDLRWICLGSAANCRQAAGKSAEDGGRKRAAKAKGSGHGNLSFNVGKNWLSGWHIGRRPRWLLAA